MGNAKMPSSKALPNTVDLSNSGHWLGFLRLGDGVDDAAFNGSLAASIGSNSWRRGWSNTPLVWQVCTMNFQQGI